MEIALSELINLLSGVIQGSSIGPVMFLMYSDGLAELLEHCGIISMIFANDEKNYLIIKNDLNVSNLQIALDLIAEWENDWQLTNAVYRH